MVTLEGCQERQRRLLSAMQAAGREFALLSRPKSICYFTGALVDPSWPQALLVDAGGGCNLVTNFEPKNKVAASVQTYTGYTIERNFGRETGHAEAVSLVSNLLRPAPTWIETEWISGGMLAAIPGSSTNVTPTLIEMRRRKLPDEIASIRVTTRLAEAGYAAIREQLEPGMTEVDAYLVIYRAIVDAAGTSVELNGDFACGVRAIGGGGAPTTRVIQEGDLCIFDLFPIFDGYMCDLCRTFVAGSANDEQRSAWAHVLAAHDIARRSIVPGGSARAVYEEIRAFLDRHPGTQSSFTHHAGHGVGMDGWEQPWLNAGSDGVFVEGEVIACEPGLYSQALQGGIRLEHNYLVTADGPVALDSFPMEL